jgi:hypothetical protein
MCCSKKPGPRQMGPGKEEYVPLHWGSLACLMSVFKNDLCFDIFGSSVFCQLVVLFVGKLSIDPSSGGFESIQAVASQVTYRP